MAMQTIRSAVRIFEEDRTISYPSSNTSSLVGFGSRNNEDTNGNYNFEGDKSYGIDPDTKEEVFLKKGPYGIYLQLGDSKKTKYIYGK